MKEHILIDSRAALTCASFLTGSSCAFGCENKESIYRDVETSLQTVKIRGVVLTIHINNPATPNHRHPP